MLSLGFCCFRCYRKKNKSTQLLWFLISVLLRSPSIADTALPNRLRNSIHLLMPSLWRDYVSLCLKDLRALIIFVCRNTVVRMKETQGKTPFFFFPFFLFCLGRMFGCWLPFFFSPSFIFFSPFPLEKAFWMIDFWFRLSHPPCRSLLCLQKFSSCLVRLTFRILIRLNIMTELL